MLSLVQMKQVDGIECKKGGIYPVSGVMAGIFLLLIMTFSSQAMEAASQAAQVFAKGVMPALLPMMVLCRLLPCRANHEHSTWRSYAAAVLFSFASGSPASAQRVRDLWHARIVSPGALEPLLAACGVMSPMFFTGTLAQWTGLRVGCWVLLLCHWVGALATAGVVWLLSRKKRTHHLGSSAKRQALSPSPPAPLRPSLPEAVTGAVTSLLAVCGAMMTFAIVAGVLRALVAAMCPIWSASHQPLLAAVWALLEVGGGTAAMLQSWPQVPMALLCALCSFGGLSIWLQNLLFANQCIRPAKLLCIRMLHGALSGGLALVIFTLFPSLMRPF